MGRLLNERHDIRWMLVNLVVTDTQHRPAPALQMPRPPQVVCDLLVLPVSYTIDFDRQSRTPLDEIDNVGWLRMLSTEFQPVIAATA